MLLKIHKTAGPKSTQLMKGSIMLIMGRFNAIILYIKHCRRRQQRMEEHRREQQQRRDGGGGQNGSQDVGGGGSGRHDSDAETQSSLQLPTHR